MNEIFEMFYGLLEAAVEYFGSFGEPAVWVRHFVIYFLAGAAAWWILSFAVVRMMGQFKEKKPDIGVWLACMTGFVTVGMLTTALSIAITVFAKQQGGSPIYAIGYAVFVIICFSLTCLLGEMVEKKCNELEVMAEAD